MSTVDAACVTGDSLGAALCDETPVGEGHAVPYPEEMAAGVCGGVVLAST